MSSNNNNNIVNEEATAAATTSMTVASSSVVNSSPTIGEPPVPSDIEARVCLLRTKGQVCICDTCEATRTRMLHRSNRKRARADDVQEEQVVEQETDTSSSLSTTTAGSSGDPFFAKKPAAAATAASAAGRIRPDGAGGSDSDVERVRIETMSSACRTILKCIGEDPCREGLQKTPERWAKALMFLCSGYEQTPEQVTNGAVFAENHDEMVVVKDIDVYSLCEHHMVPFYGRVHIGYIPNGKILGLSKLARIAELFARRLQVQERLTRQIADAVWETIEPLGVAVVVECTHLCMVMRGVQKTSAVTTTSSVRGCFESNPKTRAEFFSIIHGSGIKMC